jgi:hypothetical protein
MQYFGYWVGLTYPGCCYCYLRRRRFDAATIHSHSLIRSRTPFLSPEPVQGLALPLERVDHVHGRHGLASRVFRVRDGIADAVLQKDLEYTTGLFINESTDTLDPATTGQTTNGRLGNALDVVAQDLSVTFGAALAELCIISTSTL